MSEETRRIRAEAIAAANIEIEKLRGEIVVLEDCIVQINYRIPPELPEDHAWRLAQLDPIQRGLIEITEMMFQRNLEHELAEHNSFIDNLEFCKGTEWKVNTKLQVNYPNNFTIGPLKEEPQ